MGLGSKILATTGFQNKIYSSKSELTDLLSDVMKSQSKTLEYVQGSLRSASDVYKKGGNVTMKYRDQLFRLHYDNRRVLRWESSIPGAVEKLVDSDPIVAVEECKNLRYIGMLHKQKMYSKFTAGGLLKNKYVCQEEVAVRHFLKGLVTSPPSFNLPSNPFKSNKEVIDFLKRYKPGLRLTPDRVSKYRVRVMKMSKIQRSKASEAFVKWVTQHFPTFDESSFFVTKK